MLTIGAVPGGFEIVGESSEIRHNSGRVRIRIASSRASHAAARRSAASQLFSSCAAINRLSGSQAA
jgi:hypothetical protein